MAVISTPSRLYIQLYVQILLLFFSPLISFSRPDEDRNLISRPDEDRNLVSRPDEDRNLVSRPDEDRNLVSRPDEDRNLVSRPDEDRNLDSRPDEDRILVFMYKGGKSFLESLIMTLTLSSLSCVVNTSS